MEQIKQTNSLIVSTQGAVADANTIYHSFDFETIISIYLSQLDCTETTKKIYRRCLNTFNYYLNKRGILITDVNRVVVLDYKRYLIEEHVKNEEKVNKKIKEGTIKKDELKNRIQVKGLTSRTAGLYLSALKSLFRFLKPMDALLILLKILKPLKLRDNIPDLSCQRSKQKK